ncbi:MAG: hypothetical protein E2O68_06935 [Deltaproteobacteria bacterium]|nr:MAG: hypothetical protein E2O68_06935 [Deltaproteobacteria bacterium]
MRIFKVILFSIFCGWGNYAFSDQAQVICNYLGNNHNSIEVLRTGCKYPITAMLQRSGGRDLVPLWEEGINKALKANSFIQREKEKLCNKSGKRNIAMLKKYVKFQTGTINDLLNHMDIFREATNKARDCSKFKKGIRTRSF